MSESGVRKKRGVRDVVLAVVAAALIMSPSYLSRIISRRTSVDLSILGVMSLGLFLVGVFLLVKVLRD
jgi:hypothetical protein